jgi:hypothetical protein
MSIFGSIGDIGDIVRKTSKAGFNVNFNMNVGFNRNNMAGTVGGGRDRN